ncbi:MAG TPA: methyltransferase domain-containing protein [Candidatus Sulfotelmatobacter sp.]|nr:methyltransferase domain-containing protein [Candidatus Sulfotelmatobacter sp.]
MDDAGIQAELAKYKFYHVIPVTPTISTPGVQEFVPLQTIVHQAIDKVDFAGKRVLDIGCRDGLYCFEAEKRGAAEITGIDNCLSLGATEFLIPFFQSRVRMREGSLYELPEYGLGPFDVVIFAGVLYHLRYPFSALRILSDSLGDGGTMIVETAIICDPNQASTLYCPVGKESPYEWSSCTFFNLKGLRDTLRCFGLVVTDELLLTPIRPEFYGAVIRAAFVCRKDAAVMADFPHDYWLGKSHKAWQF